MKRKDQKEQARHSGSVDQRDRPEKSVGHNRSQGVTTNPQDVGAGDGSAPSVRHGQDSVTWKAEGQPAPRTQAPKSDGRKKSRSKEADAGEAPEQQEQDAGDEDGMKQGARRQDPPATLPAGAPHVRRSTM